MNDCAYADGRIQAFGELNFMRSDEHTQYE